MGSFRSATLVAGSLATFISSGWLLQSCPLMADVRSALQSRSEADVHLRSGRVGEILREIAPQDADPEGGSADLGEPSHKRSGDRVLGMSQRLVDADPEEALRSTTQVTREHHSPGVPTISLWVDEGDLRDPVRGIIPNWTEKWERDAEVSYFEEGELVFSAKCGVRLHGGTTRVGTIMDKRGLSWRSFRLRFRKRYGCRAIPTDVMLPERAGPIKALTLRGNYFLPQAVAFDIARKLGNLVPETRMARLVLNGEPLHTYSLIDHTGRRQFEERLGHSDFILESVYLPDPLESASYLELRDSIQGLRGPDTRKRAEELVDLDDYMRHMFVLMYCAPADWGEGSCFKDLTEESPRWRWVHWDLDNAFRVVNNQRIQEGDVPIWEKEFLNLALKPYHKARQQARVFLFQRLVKHDPEFRYEFANLVQDLLNHEVTQAFVWKAVQAHKVALDWKYRERSRLARLKKDNKLQGFARHRPAHIRKDLASHFDLQPARELHVGCSERVTVKVDGRNVALPYAGWYFPRFPIDLKVPKALEARFSHWLVEGEVYSDPVLPKDMVKAGEGTLEVKLILKPQ